MGDRFYESVRGHTILCDPENIGGPDNLDAIYPDYIKMCEGFGVKAEGLLREDLRQAMKKCLMRMNLSIGSDCSIPEHVLPMIPQGNRPRKC